ncbi:MULTISPECIES: XkdX family protein [Bacillus]|uniref:XkdX family protein n=1 Tax=Bacillus TaxID=1386 RepID=UPI000EE3D9B3|nr:MULTISPECIES: XkdX family protein [Bacillus]MBU8968042.1 XkdX family protein [Bacillus altitudinis]MCY7692738.1 XkdX family protein [Bacillus altitudinis]MED1424971.1 XkdX family protein [Bacillus altitudinis]MED1480165.1 XkdX family protein [Bacillus altitudinis]QII25520.1 XkdX family protein [Bacillus altitudinis]
MNLNFWVLALFYKWATIAMVKQAMSFDDCTIEDLEEGIQKGYLTIEQYEQITGEPYEV